MKRLYIIDSTISTIRFRPKNIINLQFKLFAKKKKIIVYFLGIDQQLKIRIIDLFLKFFLANKVSEMVAI